MFKFTSAIICTIEPDDFRLSDNGQRYLQEILRDIDGHLELNVAEGKMWVTYEGGLTDPNSVGNLVADLKVQIHAAVASSGRGTPCTVCDGVGKVLSERGVWDRCPTCRPLRGST